MHFGITRSHHHALRLQERCMSASLFDPLGYIARRVPPKVLSHQQIHDYDNDGFIERVGRCVSVDVAGDAVKSLERMQKRFRSARPSLPHLRMAWAFELCTLPAVLDAVQDIIGPNIMIYESVFWPKESHFGCFVGWHQDAHYWGIEPAHIVTAWIALTDVLAESGPLEFIRGSHLKQLQHVDTYGEDNLLSRGQEIVWDRPRPFSCAKAILSAGEFSLFHVQVAHCSGLNVSGHCRIGLAIRYCAPNCKPVDGKGSALLVRGQDTHGNFQLLAPPSCRFSDSDQVVADLVKEEVSARAMIGADMKRVAEVQHRRGMRNTPSHLKVVSNTEQELS